MSEAAEPTPAATPVAAPAAKTEPTATPAAPAAKPGADKLALSWEKVSQTEARLRDERAQIKREREEHAAAVAKAQAEASEIAELRRLAKEDPAGLIDKLGGKTVYEEATRRYLNKGEASPQELIRKQQERLDAIEKETQARKAQEDEQRQAAEQQRRGEEYLRQVGEVLKAGGEKYELTVAHGEEGLVEVAKLVVLWKQRFGEELTPTDAAGKVEEFYEKRLTRLKDAKKLSALLGAQAPTTAAKKADPAKATQTLTSDLSGAAPVSARKPSSRRARIEALAARIDRARST